MTQQHCSRCRRRKVIDYSVEPADAWRAVVLNRYQLGKLCAECFDLMAEQARVRYSLANLSGTSWSDQPPPRNPYKGRRF